ncbi:MAG: hypothetical protein PHF30_02340 [Bacilli bacterium]|nr:hypothetical protein [Bacilli bacterium]
MEEQVNEIEKDGIVDENKETKDNKKLLFLKEISHITKDKFKYYFEKISIFIASKNKSISERRITNKRKKLQYATLLEKPIDSKKEDKFGIEPYVKQLNYAIKKGANFIAINGEHGSGKSSIVNVLRKSKTSLWRRLWMKNTFVNINFMNINEKMIDVEGLGTAKTPQQLEQINDIKANTINNYHRYLVNQVANDIYRHPYEIEKLFYRDTFSYTVVKKINNPIIAYLMDKILLILTSIISLVIIYMTFFNVSEKAKQIGVFEDLYGMILPKLPFMLLLFLIIAVIYGFGISKPDNESKSPMLDIDKCRNNFCKVIFNKLSFGSTLYLVIDDLDRIDSKLQAQILSLLNNEYYPLNRIIKRIRIVFICMIDLKDIEPDLKDIDLDGQKLFDYILDVSNNQNNILTHYVVDTIEHSETNLSYIFNKSQRKDYLISIILNYYDSIRKIKHCLSKIINKYNYLNYKKIDIEYSQLIFFTILQDNYKVDDIMKVCETILRNENGINDVKSIINNPDSSVDSTKLNSIIFEAYNKSIINENYYIYLYNFMDKSNLLLNSELELCRISKQSLLEMTNDDVINFYKIMSEIDEGRYNKIYNEIFKYCIEENKLLFFENKRFLECSLKMNEIDNLIDLNNLYKQNYVSKAYPNIYSSKIFTSYQVNKLIIKDLYSLNEKRLKEQTDENNVNYLDELGTFFDNMRDSVYNRFDFKNLLINLNINETIFNLLFSEIKNNKIPIGYEMFVDKIIKFENLSQNLNLSIINKLYDIDKDFHLKVVEFYLKCGIKTDELISIACDKRYVVSNIDYILDKVNGSELYLSLENIKSIIEKYKYNIKLEKHIIKILDDKNKLNVLINYIRENEFEITTEVMDKLQSIPYKYEFPKFYESRFINAKNYKLYIFSKIIKSKFFEIKPKYKNVPEYKKAIKDVYQEIGMKWAKYQFNDSFIDFILNNFEFNTMTFNESNFWKIKILTNKINDVAISNKIFDKVYADGTLSNLCSYCAKRENQIINKTFLQLLKDYAISKNIDFHVVGKITSRINNL